MILFLVLAAAIWFLGRLLHVPSQARWLSIGLLYVGVLAALLVLPPEAGLRHALGESVSMWLVLGVFAALVAGYSFGLRALRARVRPENRAEETPASDATPDPDAPLSDAELNRYMRQILLREVGGPGQMRLKRAKVLVVGAGGLGAPVLQYLAAAGVGTIGVIDDDVVEVSNLHRQVIHTADRLEMPKVFSAQAALRDLNPHVAVRPYHRRLSDDIALDLIGEYDLVLDGTDNFDTRYLVNRTCVALGKPLIAAAITQWEGQLSLYHPAQGGPCYQCVFPEAPAPGLVPSCAEAGVVGPLPGVVGAMMALEALKHLTGAGRDPMGELILYDGLFGENRKIRVKRRADCPICGAA